MYFIPNTMGLRFQFTKKKKSGEVNDLLKRGRSLKSKNWCVRTSTAAFVLGITKFDSWARQFCGVLRLCTSLGRVCASTCGVHDGHIN